MRNTNKKTNIMGAKFTSHSTQKLADVVSVLNIIVKEVAKEAVIIFYKTNDDKLKVSAFASTHIGGFTIYVDVTTDELNSFVKGIANLVDSDGTTRASVLKVDDGTRYLINYREFVRKLNSLSRTRKIDSLTAVEAVKSDEVAAADVFQLSV
jgi:hypothetical protein